MPMKRCKDCGTEISKSAKTCPKCGRKLKHGGVRVILGIVLIIIGVAVIASTGNNGKSMQTGNQNVQTSVITKDNYDKITDGMTEQEVKDLLGEPTMTSETETPGVGKMILNHYQETFSTQAIEIYFLNGKVYMKNYVEL